MKHSGVKRVFCLILLVLICVLGALTLQRIRTARASAPPTEAPLSQAAAGAPEDSESPAAEADRPEIDISANPEVSQPEGTPAPTPAPTPTPRPLRELAICEDNLDPALFDPARERGTVELVQYATTDLVSGGDFEIMKDMAVYLPYGYDETQQYDVLILLHCAWADHRFWLVQDREYRTFGEGVPPSQEDWTLPGAGSPDSSIPVSVPNMLDRMIEEGWCRPLIVVAPCVYFYDHQPSAAGTQYDYTQFRREFGPNFLSYIAEHYATYAADGSREALAAAREHFGVLGASFGAYAAYLSVIGENFDLVAWYTFCGGGVIDPGYLVSAWESAGTQDLPLRLLYISEGEFDDRAGPESSVGNLLYYGQSTGRTFTGENVRYTMIRGWGHEDHSYLVGLFNTLQLFFR